MSRGGGGRGAEVFVADELFISTREDGALEMSNRITCFILYTTEIYYLLHVESARNHLFQQ